MVSLNKSLLVEQKNNMKEQKIVITDSEDKINNLIEDGWLVKNILPQHVANGTSYSRGYFCFLLERTL